MPRLISLNVGLPRDVAWREKTVRTGIWKTAVPDRRMVRRLNIDGDGQGDLAGHGGENRAVLVYQIDSYRYWESQLRRTDFTLGQFGENFTVEGLPDDEVCVGDRYRIGSALFEVTQPRVTCYRVGIRTHEPQMAALLVSHHRPGFYFRVLEEGEIGAGDEITKISSDPERMTVAEIDALLYLPGRRGDALKRAVRIPALSPGWKTSLEPLIDQGANGASGIGNPGLTTSAGPPLAWSGFRSLRVARVDRESAGVSSFTFAAPDDSPLPASLPGQFLVLKLWPKSALPSVLRNYSLSGAPDAGLYRVSVKQELNGVASTFLHSYVAIGTLVLASAPRGNFTLQPGDGPVVLLSAGIGATPVMAMLHALASTQSKREVWWLYGARDRAAHPFADESRALLKQLSNSRSCVAYSKPGAHDQCPRDYDTPGRLSLSLLRQLDVPPNADFYLCGPSAFLSSFTAELKPWGTNQTRIHAEIFGAGESSTPGIATLSKPVHPPSGILGSGPQVSFVRSGLTVPWNAQFQNLLELAEACDVPVKWACRSGVCHTCECVLFDGVIDYQPDPLEPPAEGNFLTCCSQPRVDISIDL